VVDDYLTAGIVTYSGLPSRAAPGAAHCFYCPPKGLVAAVKNPHSPQRHSQTNRSEKRLPQPANARRKNPRALDFVVRLALFTPWHSMSVGGVPICIPRRDRQPTQHHRSKCVSTSARESVSWYVLQVGFAGENLPCFWCVSLKFFSLLSGVHASVLLPTHRRRQTKTRTPARFLVPNSVGPYTREMRCRSPTPSL